jgi:hypothetical protein
MSETYVAVYYCPAAGKESSRFLGAFESIADLTDYMTETTTGDRPFVGAGLADLTPGNTIVCKDFDVVEIHVTLINLTKQAKNVYITDSMIATTSKAGKTILHTVPLTTCPMCGKYGVAADDDGHCSYACATGT